jgi:hypothetical protein
MRIARVSLAGLRAISPKRRRTLRGYNGHFPAFAAEIVGATRTVTILRDPVERTISMLKQRQRRHAPHMSLTDLYEDPDVFSRFLDNHQTKMFALEARDDPESFTDAIRIDRARLDAAKERLASIDVIGFQEDHHGVVQAARQAFGWPEPQATWSANVSPETDVPSGLRERIAEDMGWDRELYDFAAGLVAGRAAAA